MSASRRCLILMLIIFIAIIFNSCGAIRNKGPEFSGEFKSAGEGKALIYIYRENKAMVGVDNWWVLYANGKPIMEVNDGSYFVYETDPGLIAFSALQKPGLIAAPIVKLTAKEKECMKLNVEAGKTYYLEFKLKFCGTNLFEVPEAKAKTAIVKCRYSPVRETK